MCCSRRSVLESLLAGVTCTQCLNVLQGERAALVLATFQHLDLMLCGPAFTILAGLSGR